MQTVLVAGGAGFIGSHLCSLLLSKGYKVICLDNCITGDENNIIQLQKNNNFLFVNHDITKSPEVLDSVADGINYIFHLASPASPNKKSPRSYINYPIETLLVNSIGTYFLMKFAKKHNANVLYASSSEIYGDPKVSPQPESYFGNVNPNGVRSVYDEAKRFGEAMTMAYVRKHNLNCRIVRIFNTYGPLMKKDDGRVVSNFINQALENKDITIYGDGSQTRSFCYVDDMIDGLCRLMDTGPTVTGPINLGKPEECTILELADKILELTGSKSRIVHKPAVVDDPRQRRPDISLANKALGWSPKVSLEEGLKKTVSYFDDLLREAPASDSAGVNVYPC